MNIEYLITQLLAVKSKVDVMLIELEDEKKKEKGEPTWAENWEWVRLKEGGE